MLGKLKRLLQRTLFYKWYLLLCKHYRFWVQDKQYTRIYRRAAKKPLQETKVERSSSSPRPVTAEINTTGRS